MAIMPHAPHAHHTADAHGAGRAHTVARAVAHTHSAPASPVEAAFRHPAFPYATFPLRRRCRHSPPLDVSVFAPPSEKRTNTASGLSAAVTNAPPSFVDPFTGAPARAPSAPSAPSLPTGGVSMVRSVSQPVLTSAEAAAYAATRARRRQRSRPSIIGVFPHAGSSRASGSSASAATTELADPPEEEDDNYDGEDVHMAEDCSTLPLSPTPRAASCSGPQRTATSVLEPRLNARPYPATPSPPPLARHACAVRRLTPSPRDAEPDYAGSCATAQSTISRAAAWRSASFKLARAVRD